MSRTAWLPADWCVALDPGVRRVDGGSVLIGGSPLRILRLTGAGERLVDRLDRGEPVPQADGSQRLVRRLLDVGIAHPRPGAGRLTSDDVTVVVPTRDEHVVARVDVPMIVVDDGSAAPVHVDGATVLRHDTNRGPGAARNTGWRRATTVVVAFLDADCEPEPGWLDHLLGHFDDPLVAAVAPRVITRTPDSLPAVLAAYEASRPTLDRGEREAIVRPRSPVPFVPTAALLVRRAALEQVDGFDESMRFGEDVDFVWRLHGAGWTVRYDPRVRVTVPARLTATAWFKQRFDYGTSAAALARTHGRAVAPLAVSPWSAVSWALGGTGHPVAGATVAAATTAQLAPRLRGLHQPWLEAARLAGKGHLYAGTAIADAVRRAWWPIGLAAAAVSRPARRALVAAAVLAPVAEWRSRRPPLDVFRWTAMRIADDVTYGAGVWVGCVRERSFAALAPDLTSWPGRRPALVSTGVGAQRVPPVAE